MPVRFFQPSGPVKALPEEEPPPQVAEGEVKPAAAVAEPVLFFNIK
jgi:hypothetical protein